MKTVPELAGAACRAFLSPYCWAAGADEDQREAARWVCLTACPVLAEPGLENAIGRWLR